MKDHEGTMKANLLELSSATLFLNPRQYKVEYTSKHYLLMSLQRDSIMDIGKTKEAVREKDDFVKGKHAVQRRKHTTKEWEVSICWEDEPIT